MKASLPPRTLAIILFATIGLIGLYPAVLLIVAPLNPLLLPAIFWLSWLTALIAFFAAAVGIGRVIRGRRIGIIPTVLGAIVTFITLCFIPLSQYSSPGTDCLSGCIVTHTTLAPGLLVALAVCYIIGGYALLVLMTASTWRHLVHIVSRRLTAKK